MNLSLRTLFFLVIISSLILLLPVSVLAHSVQQKNVEGLTLTFSTSPLDIPTGQKADVFLLVNKQGENDPITDLDITIKLSQEGKVYNEGKLIAQGSIYQNSFTFTQSGVTDAIIEFSFGDEQIATRFLIDVTTSFSLQSIIIPVFIAIAIIGVIYYIYRAKQRQS